MRPASKAVIGLSTLFILASCDIEGSDNSNDIPEQGLFVKVEANRHQSGETAQVAAAVFKDGVAVELLAGDLFEAQNVDSTALLKDQGYYQGSYSAPLALDDIDQELVITVVHKPLEAREGRWYPIDIIATDPGPGELVGHSARLRFPPNVVINDPMVNSLYTSTDETIELSWEALGEGDTMQLRSAISCDNGLAELHYGTEIMLGDDDGLQGIGVDDFIYDSSDSASDDLIDFIDDTARTMLQELLDELSAGKIDEDYFARKKPVNPIVSQCEIRLFLFRQREGTFDDAFDQGSVIGSTSAEITLHYQPSI